MSENAQIFILWALKSKSLISRNNLKHFVNFNFRAQDIFTFIQMDYYQTIIEHVEHELLIQKDMDMREKIQPCYK